MPLLGSKESQPASASTPLINNLPTVSLNGPGGRLASPFWDYQRGREIYIFRGYRYALRDQDTT